MRTVVRRLLIVLLALSSTTPPLLAWPRAPDETVVFLPTVANPPPVAIRNVGMMRLPDPVWFNVAGEFINLTSSPIYSVTLRMQFFDENDQLIPIQPDGNLHSFSTLLPGRPSPFVMEYPFFVENGGHIDWSTRIEVTLTGWSTEHPQSFASVTIISQHVSVNGYTYVRGSLRNDHPYRMRNVRVACWVPEWQEAYSLDYQGIALSPGETNTYQCFFGWLLGDPSQADAFLKGLYIDTQGEVVP